MAYNLLDLLDQLGGVFDFMAYFFMFILTPYSKFSFIMTATSKLFLAEDEDKEKKTSIFGSGTQPKKVNLSNWDNFSLFLSTWLGECLPKKLQMTKSKWKQFYKVGEDKIASSLNIKSFVANMRDLQIIIKMRKSDPATKMWFSNKKDHCIDLKDKTDSISSVS